MKKPRTRVKEVGVKELRPTMVDEKEWEGKGDRERQGNVKV